MAKRVLSVGQCVPDGAAIKAFLTREFGAIVETAETADEAMAAVHNGPFDLVMVNRIFDEDGGSGLDLVRAIKGDATVGRVPVLLVSNHSDAQDRAVESGAVRGFGKAQVGDSGVVELLSEYLADAAPE